MYLNFLRTNIPILSMLTIFIVDLILIFTTHFNWNHSMSKYLPLKSNIQYLKSELSTGHLWLEEAIGGDKYVNIKTDVMDKFARKEFLIYLNESKTILDSGDDLIFYNDLEKIETLSKELEEIVIQRWENKDEYKIGSDLDQIFDEVFNETINFMDKLDNKVDKKLQKEFQERKEHFVLILVLFLFVNISAFTLLYKIKKQNLKYEDELFEEKKRAEITLYSIGDAVITTNEKGIVNFLNPIAQKLTGYSLKEAVGQEFEKVFDIYNDDKEKVESPIKRVLEEGVIVGLANGTILKSKDSEFFIIEDSAAPIKDEEGHLLGIVVVFHDVTQETKLRKKLSHREKILMQQSKLASMGEMIENIAHQWRQPLSAVTTAASGMKLEKEYGILNEKEFYRNIDVIIESSNSLSKTIDSFRDFFKPQNEKIVFNLNKIISNAISIMDSKFQYNKIKVIRDCEDVQIKGFSSELLQVISALLNNSNEALSSCEYSRYIFIECRKLDSSVEIKIKDNAGGFDEANLHRIFEPYFTTKHKSFGRGIGLFMVQEIINKYMSGRIDVANKTYDFKGEAFKGLEFIIELKIH